MTNEEYIAYIEEWLKDEYALNPKDREVLTAAIKALEELPKRRKEVKRWKAKALEQQDDDCISRQAVNEIINDIRDCISVEGYWAILERMKKLSPVNPQEPKTGHWMRKTKVDGVYDIAGVKTWGVKCQCDKCDFTTTVIEDFGYYKYCPNCGTKMIEPQGRSDKE